MKLITGYKSAEGNHAICEAVENLYVVTVDGDGEMIVSTDIILPEDAIDMDATDVDFFLPFANFSGSDWDKLIADSVIDCINEGRIGTHPKGYVPGH